ncbi:MAG TPA: TPM domain-containing protein [Nitrospiraceae bacterium]|nr:TPM domain-containing protein [Nitrospiraceae bacterium]
MRGRLRTPLIRFILLGVLPLASALTLASLVFALDVPPLTGRVVDRAQVLPADVAASLAHDLEAHEAKTGNQVAVLILPTLEGEPLEEFSHRVAVTWKLGQKGTDNGVLLLIALRERKVRIEVGYGLEGTLTDLRAAHIIRQEIVPRFRSGDLPGGIASGVQAILGTIEGVYTATEAPPVGVHTGDEPSGFEYVIIGVIVGFMAGLLLSHGLQSTRALLGSVLAFLVAQFASVLLGVIAAGVTALLLWLIVQANRGRGRGGGWGDGVVMGPGGGFGGSFGDSGGGGGFSGGGGDFGGGGASGGW